MLLKVLLLNKLYSTQIPDIHIESLARHISGLGIDRSLVEGQPSTVALIARCEGLSYNLSFASKYCSWHNPTAYPIYDHYADKCLWTYKMRCGFAQFHRKDLKDYASFREVVIKFRNFYKLGSFNFREIDKFLWLQGKSLDAQGY